MAPIILNEALELLDFLLDGVSDVLLTLGFHIHIWCFYGCTEIKQNNVIFLHFLCPAFYFFKRNKENLLFSSAQLEPLCLVTANSSTNPPIYYIFRKFYVYNYNFLDHFKPVCALFLPVCWTDEGHSLILTQTLPPFFFHPCS